MILIIMYALINKINQDLALLEKLFQIIFRN